MSLTIIYVTSWMLAFSSYRSNYIAVSGRINWTGSSNRYTPITRLYTRQTTIDLAQYYYTTHDSAASHDTTGLEYRDISLGTRAFRTCLIRYTSRDEVAIARALTSRLLPVPETRQPTQRGCGFPPHHPKGRDTYPGAHAIFFYMTRNSEWKIYALT